DKKNGKYKNILSLSKSLRNEKFDLILNLHRFASSGIIAVLSRGKKLFGFKKNPMSFLYSKSYAHEIGNGEHEVDRNLSLLKSLNINSLIRRPSLFPSTVDEEKVLSYKSNPYFCIAPASVWATKQLPKAKWIELIQKLSKSGQVYVLGSPDDKDFCQDIINDSGITAINLAGNLSLLQSAALMRDAERSFVNDSGPLHLASSVNAKVTAFFCSTIPAFGFGPLSDDSKVLEESKNLDCRPCGLHGYKVCPKGHFKCGDISISI
ncbi:MAG: glycosyltransferase family 9 protein, partial [Bacteroidota bacterium]